MAVLDVRDIKLSYGIIDILTSVSFTVNKGDKIGVAGVNGAGKTSLFSIICGTLTPTSGNVYISKDTTVGILRQQTENDFGEETIYEYALSAFSDLIEAEKKLDHLSSQLSGGEEHVIKEYTSLSDRFSAMGGYDYKQRATAMLGRFGFAGEELSRPARLLSGGQKTRLNLVNLLLREPDIILLDEPTNHLDIPAIEWLEGYVKQSKKTFLIVSHDRYFLDRVTNRTLELENGFSSIYDGSYSVFREKKDKLREDQMKAYLLQQKEIKRLEAFIEQQRRWNREKNIIAAESRQKAIDRMVKIERPQDKPKSISFALTSTNAKGFDVLSVRNLSKSFPGHKLFSDLSFEVKHGDRLFVLGENGTGKSTLIKILTGRERADSGVFELGYNQKIGYYDQEQQLLDDSSTVLEELWSEYTNLTATQVRSALAKFGFIGDDVFKSISVLSGGERARLSICKMIMTGVSLLVLDEPTNHLDMASKEMLENALKEYEGTVIAVSHDRYFISALADRILELTSTHGYSFHKCSYEKYMEGKNTGTDSAGKFSAAPVSESKQNYEQVKKDKNRKRAIERRLAQLEKRSAEIEKELEEVSKQEQSNSTDYELLASLYETKTTLEYEQLSVMEEQFALEEEYMNFTE
ncbi:MAG: ABC-F family ATP-binding cassette domain-containing protein [Clostridia bacterium]|nr:ABC-F family ATP-binding cassette domain-containing protein [Clostridia bacterium]